MKLIRKSECPICGSYLLKHKRTGQRKCPDCKVRSGTLTWMFARGFEALGEVLDKAMKPRKRAE